MIKVLRKDLKTIQEKAVASGKAKSNYWENWSADQKIQRMVICWNKDAYSPPHKHPYEEGIEVMVWIKGKIGFIEFDEEGNVIDKILLDGKENLIAECNGRNWHTIISLEDDSHVFEIQDGPFIKGVNKEFVKWAPPLDGDPKEIAKFRTYLQDLFR